jgi:hypothetical protein
MIDQLKGFCGCQIDTLFQMKKKKACLARQNSPQGEEFCFCVCLLRRVQKGPKSSRFWDCLNKKRLSSLSKGTFSPYFSRMRTAEGREFPRANIQIYPIMM